MVYTQINCYSLLPTCPCQSRTENYYYALLAIHSSLSFLVFVFLYVTPQDTFCGHCNFQFCQQFLNRKTHVMSEPEEEMRVPTEANHPGSSETLDAEAPSDTRRNEISVAERHHSMSSGSSEGDLSPKKRLHSLASDEVESSETEAANMRTLERSPSERLEDRVEDFIRLFYRSQELHSGNSGFGFEEDSRPWIKMRVPTEANPRSSKNLDAEAPPDTGRASRSSTELQRVVHKETEMQTRSERPEISFQEKHIIMRVPTEANPRSSMNFDAEAPPYTGKAHRSSTARLRPVRKETKMQTRSERPEISFEKECTGLMTAVSNILRFDGKLVWQRDTSFDKVSLETMSEPGVASLSGGENGVILDHCLKKIMEIVSNEEVRKMGVCGRAGVGKTTLVEALKEQPDITSMFECVIWITVPKIWNSRLVQLQISRQAPGGYIGGNEKAESRRLLGLLGITKFLLILDDVSEFINLEMVGVPEPIPESGSKIVLMTRSEEVCKEMAVDSIIRVEDLLSWELFCQNVGEVVNSPSLQHLARQVVERCCHYSHAIILMARALKDVSDVGIWINVLDSFSGQQVSLQGNFDDLMLTVLNFSYERLPDDTTRECLKVFAWPHELLIPAESLIQEWIGKGLVDSKDKGAKILENLISSNLLTSMKDGKLVKLQQFDREVLVSLFQREEERLFLMRGGMGLTEPPEAEEWERSKEVHLMGNQISVLPENLRCPKLETLYLQSNCKLRAIPPLFFENMPGLQKLNLSRTRIKSLPDSLFRLVSLKMLWLSHCDLLRALSPRIGELKNLEVLDLEGTEIMDLPKQVKQLTNLTCLKVSFYEAGGNSRSEQTDSVIPKGIISSLTRLEQLTIDVSAEDERWNQSAENVASEIHKLTRLQTLKFYFPEMQLLRHVFQWHQRPTRNYTFTVGRHVKRIMSRLPQNVDLLLEKYSRCLKYINGQDVSEDIKLLLLYATAFLLDRHSNVKKLSDFGLASLKKLQCCIVSECDQLEALIDGDQINNYSRSAIDLKLDYLCIYRMRNFRGIWEGTVHNNISFTLKSLTLCMCPKLTSIFTPQLLGSLYQLEELQVDDCPSMTTLVSCNDSDHSSPYEFPRLKKLSLHFLPELASISDVLHVSRVLEWISIYHCPKLKSLPVYLPFHSYLKEIKGEADWWEALEWDDQQHSWDHIFVSTDVCD